MSQITLWVFAAALAHSGQTNPFAFWILCCVFPTFRSVFNATVSLQSFRVLGFNASVTIFFHKDDCRLPGKLHIMCTCMCACICAIFGRLPVFSLHQRSGYGSLLGPFLLRLDHIPQNPALVGNMSVFFPAIVKKTNSLTVCVGPGLTITGPLWVAAGYSKNQHLLYPRLRLFNVQIQFLPRTLGLFRRCICIVLNSLSPDLQLTVACLVDKTQFFILH